MAMLINGLVRGIRTRTAGQNNEYNFAYLVVEEEDFRLHELQLSKSANVPAFLDGIASLVGKRCTIPFYIRSFKGANGTGFSLNYSGEELPQVLKA
jgi:hypothetical protein